MNRNELMGLKQLQASARGSAVRIAAVFDPWRRGNVRVALKSQDADNATITVTGPDGEDTWTWRAATSQWAPATLTGRLADGKTVTVDAQDKAHIPHLE
jgi:hypothetical protein